MDYDFDLTPREYRFSALRNGKPERFVLSEISEAANSTYNIRLMSYGRQEGGKVVGVDPTGLAILKPLRISLCLFRVKEVDGQEVREPVTEQEVGSWPSKVVDALADKLAALNGDDEGADASKKGLEPTAASSG